MAVQFLPTGETPAPLPERENLAEVIELRTGGSSSEKTVAPESSVSGASAREAHAPEPPGESAVDAGVRLLARQARSTGELRDDLIKRGHDPHEVEAVVDDFVTSHYLDDASLARVTAGRLREQKGASRSQIRSKLRARKLPDAAIEAALAELDPGEEEALLRSTAAARARRLGDLPRDVAERRLLGFLARRGWSGEPAYRAVR